MEITVKGKSFDVGEALRTHVEDQMEDAVSKYFAQAIDATVVFSKQGHRVCADISSHPGPRGFVVQSSIEAADAYVAFDGALERITKQLRRYKRRLTNHHKKDNGQESKAQQYVIQAEHHENEVPEVAEPIVVAEMPTVISTLSVSEAVMLMDLAHAPAMMFHNAKSGAMNVVYRRDDGNIGWIDPAINQ